MLLTSVCQVKGDTSSAVWMDEVGPRTEFLRVPAIRLPVYAVRCRISGHLLPVY